MTAVVTKMVQVNLLLRVYLCTFFVNGLVRSAVEPGQREDVIGQYSITNEKQCQRLCWYRQLCNTYSYYTRDIPVSPAVSTSLSVAHNCVLHSKSVFSTTENKTLPDAGWIENAASSSHINNACKTRPCSEREICVPASSVSVISMSMSYVCLSLTSYCGDPQPVADGDVIVSGRRPGDAAVVTCNNKYVASPENVSMELVCLATSKWTAFQGECLRYEFFLNKEGNFRRRLPWKLREKSTICFKGMFTDAGSFFVNTRPDMQHNMSEFHISFRYQHGSHNTTEVLWNTKKNETWQDKNYLGPMPLVPGDSFNLTLHVQSDRLQLVLNEAHVYKVPMLGVNNNTDGFDLRGSNVFGIGGTVNLTYVNFLERC
ncbi:uncharacterized protein [Littorina saxatilis]|uniref:uncharacterized protein n=1 Tax=Littorina saxatilis TaxID=31220 RepID=UPI0038B65719